MLAFGRATGSSSTTRTYPTPSIAERVAATSIAEASSMFILRSIFVRWSLTLATGVVTLSICAPATSAQKVQLPGEVISMGASALGIEDFNGDGLADAVMGRFNALYFASGSGTGPFVSEETIAVTSLPILDLAVADWNGDGRLDVLGVSAQSSKLTAVANFGSSFGPAVSSMVADTTSTIARLAVSDLDNDGTLDAAVNLGDVYVLRGHGTGSFTVTAGLPIGGSLGLATGDLDVDGFNDLVATHPLDAIAWFRGIGGLTFAQPLVRSAGSSPTDVSIADLDTSGAPDIVVANASHSDVSILLATAPGYFQPVVSYPIANQMSVMRRLRVFDVNLDGLPDVATGGKWEGEMRLRHGTGGGALGPPQSFLVTAPGTECFGFGEFDANGWPDLVISTFNGLALYRASTGGTYLTPQVWNSSVSQGRLALGDFDENGLVDVATSGVDAGLLIHLGTGAGSFSSTPLVYPTGQMPRDLETCDVNGDGHLDLVTANVGSNNISVWRGTGSGTFSPGGNHSVQTTPGSASEPQSLAFTDINLDGNVDVLTSNLASSNLTILLGNGAGGCSASSIIPTGPINSFGIEIGDVNGDGIKDVVSANGVLNNVSILIGVNQGFAAPYFVATYTNTQALAVGDVTRDGFLDVLTNSPGGFAVLAGDGQGGFASPSSYGAWSSFGISTTFLRLGDIDGEGSSDVLTGISGRLILATSTPEGGFNIKSYAYVGLSSDIATCDLDGNGISDLAVVSGPFVTVPGIVSPPVGVNHFGSGTPGCLGTLTQTATSAPAIGNSSFGLLFQHVPKGSLGFILAGDMADLAGTDVFGIGLLWHVSLLQSTFLMAVDCPTGSGGTGFVAIPIPNDPQIQGNTYATQGVFLEPPGQPQCSDSRLKLVSSRGLAITIQ